MPLTPRTPRAAFVGVELAMLSFSSGCMDIVSYKSLGQVFTSAMTGNAALLGLDLGQLNLLGASRNLAAFCSFFMGLVLGGVLLRHSVGTPGWSRAVTRALVVEELLLLAFAAAWQVLGGPETAPMLYGLIAVSAVAMGLQSTIAHRIGVPGITTTYFTGTLTNIVMAAAERGVLKAGTAKPRPRRWPILAFLAYITGAACTGVLLAHPTSAREELLAGLPAAAVAVVLAAAALETWRGRQRG